MNETYDVNVTAPLMLTKAVLPLMKQAARTRKAEGKEDLKPLVVNMGSILGSIHNNDGRGEGKGKLIFSNVLVTVPYLGGGIYAYRSSKSALNMLTRSLSLDLGAYHMHSISIHPGWVKTDLVSLA